MRFMTAIIPALTLGIATPAVADPAPPPALPIDVADKAAKKKLAERQAATKVVQSLTDSLRANDYERWLAHFSSNAVFEVNGAKVHGVKELRALMRKTEKAGITDAFGPIKDVTVLGSGWVDGALYVLQIETYSNGMSFETYAEYTVRSGKIVKAVVSV